MTVGQWFRDHFWVMPSVEMPPALREASHRLANESLKLRQEVVLRAGSYERYEKKAAEIRETMRHMFDRMPK